MPILKWDEKYETGVAQFDQEHQQLIQRLNDLYDDIFECETIEQEQKLTADILKDLLEYVEEHFSGEEELMRLHQYPELEAHQRAHRQFSVEVEKLLQKHQGGELALSFPVFTFLKDWISNHVLVVDKRYSAFFNDKKL